MDYGAAISAARRCKGAIVTDADAPLRRLALPLDAPAAAALAAGNPLPVIRTAEGILLGVNEFAVGEEFANHIHEHLTETFIGLSGEVELWLDRTERVLITPGTVVSVPPPQEHYLRNASTAPALIAYVKNPNLSEDRIWRPWTPHPTEKDHSA